MSTNQRYISKELTHFVGAKLSQTEAEFETKQYELLIDILQSGMLKHSMSDSLLIYGMRMSLGHKLSENEMFTPSMVCFCDIPTEDLAIHVGKYSRFGLSFDKDFICNVGGSPMHYIPTDAKAPFLVWDGDELTKAELFDKMIKQYYHLFELLACATPRQYDPQLPQWDELTCFDHPDIPQNLNDLLNEYPSVVIAVRQFLDYHIFGYLKFFDHQLTEDDNNNYYFEREWRVVGNVEFGIDDVTHILIPKEYARKFREDCPDYYGQITFIDH